MIVIQALGVVLLSVLPAALLDSPPPHGRGLAQPETYASAAGGFELRVEPSRRDGFGMARVELRRDGASVWSAEWPFTPLDVAVSSRGAVAGLGWESVKVDERWIERARLRMASAAGEVLLDRGFDAADGGVSGMCLVDDLRRVIVRRVVEAETVVRESWLALDLERGTELFDVDATSFQPRVADDASEGMLGAPLALAALRGTPLCIAQWQHRSSLEGKGSYGFRYALLDPLLRPVWTLDETDAFRWPFTDEETACFWRTMHDGVRALPEEMRFELILESGRQVGRFEVARSESASQGWVVREFERRPWSPPPAPAPPTRVELEPRGTIELGVQDAGAAGAFAVGPDGRLHVRAKTTRDVHVFERDGRPLWVLHAKPDEVNAKSRAGDVLVDARGDVFAQHDEGGTSWTWFDARGERVGLVELGGPEVRLQPESGARWSIAPWRLALLDREGATLFASERRPDGRWLELQCADVAPDGGLVACSESSHHGPDLSGAARWHGPDVLLRYARDGTPGAIVELPPRDGGSRDELLVTDAWILIGGTRPQLELLRADGSEHAVFRLDDAFARRGNWSPALSPERNELWWLDGERWTVHRFSLPQNVR